LKTYVLDTSVLSTLGPGRIVPERFREWVRLNGHRLVVPTVVLAEIASGVCNLRRRGGMVRADAIARWMETLVEGFGERIVSLDRPIAKAIGELSDAATASGRHPGFADIAIAATAYVQRRSILTRNLRHFHHPGIEAIDPFATAFPASDEASG
jgi:toxin FitB